MHYELEPLESFILNYLKATNAVLCLSDLTRAVNKIFPVIHKSDEIEYVLERLGALDLITKEVNHTNTRYGYKG